jgi:hypothetical protein
MDCEYWKDIVQQLCDESRCNWASHVLSTEFVFKKSLTESKLSENELMETNLGTALKCVSQEEIIEGTINQTLGKTGILGLELNELEHVKNHVQRKIAERVEEQANFRA